MIVFFWGILSAVIGVLFGMEIAQSHHVLLAAAGGAVAGTVCFFFGLVLAES